MGKPRDEVDALARWGAVLHRLGNMEKDSNRLVDAMVALGDYVPRGEAASTLFMARHLVNAAHTTICAAIHLVNRVAPKPPEAEPHQPADRI